MNQDRYEESTMHDEENHRTWKIVGKIIKFTQKHEYRLEYGAKERHEKNVMKAPQHTS